MQESSIRFQSHEMQHAATHLPTHSSASASFLRLPTADSDAGLLMTDVKGDNLLSIKVEGDSVVVSRAFVVPVLHLSTELPQDEASMCLSA
jgi:hypothetical protein